MSNQPESKESKETDALEFDDEISLLYKKIENDIKKSIIEKPPERSFESLPLLRQKAWLEVKEGLDSLQKIIKNGMEAVFIALSEQGQSAKGEEIRDWFQQNKEKFQGLFHPEQPSSEQPDSEATLEERLGFPREHLIVMHDAAKYFFQKQRYDEALAIMVVCLQFNALLSPFWFTYGCILQEKGEQPNALYAYQIATVFDEKNPYIYAYMARSWLALENWQKAEESRQQALDLCKGESRYSELEHFCDKLQHWAEENVK